jgi:bifunctional DNase/RNase
VIGRIIRRVLIRSSSGLAHHWGGLLGLILLGSGIAGVAYWQGLLKLPGQETQVSGESFEMAVERLEQTRQAGSYNVILREKRGSRRLVVTVGPTEAFAIQSDLANMRSEGPMTYDLMRSLVKELGGDLSRVVVSNADDKTFFAKVVMNTDGRQIEIDSRPSDAIALALRAKVPIFADALVLERAGVRQASN